MPNEEQNEAHEAATRAERILLFRRFLGMPTTVAECINAGATYKPEVLAALRTFRRSKPWAGSLDERKAKFETLHAELTRIYQTSTALAYEIEEEESDRGNGVYRQEADAIVLQGKLSVVTYLHEFAHSVFGADEKKACQWSVSLYHRIFPISAARMTTDGHMIRKPL